MIKQIVNLPSNQLRITQYSVLYTSVIITEKKSIILVSPHRLLWVILGVLGLHLQFSTPSLSRRIDGMCNLNVIFRCRYHWASHLKAVRRHFILYPVHCP